MMVITSTLWLGVRMTFLCSLLVAAAGFGAIIVTQNPGIFAQEYGHCHFNMHPLTHCSVIRINTFNYVYRNVVLECPSQSHG